MVAFRVPLISCMFEDTKDNYSKNKWTMSTHTSPITLQYIHIGYICCILVDCFISSFWNLGMHTHQKKKSKAQKQAFIQRLFHDKCTHLMWALCTSFEEVSDSRSSLSCSPIVPPLIVHLCHVRILQTKLEKKHNKYDNSVDTFH